MVLASGTIEMESAGGWQLMEMLGLSFVDLLPMKLLRYSPGKAHQTPQAKEKMRIRPPRPLMAPVSTNLQIWQFLGSLQRLSHDINGSEQSSEHITIWPHPIGFANGIKRLNWIKDFPYLAEYSYFAECFRKKAPGQMWAGLFVTAIESWVGKKVLAEWHVWAAIIISPEAPATGKKLLIYNCDGEDVDFGHCRAREALPLSIQRDFWRPIGGKLKCKRTRTHLIGRQTHT
ncbi:hypothetical protein B0H14DRAFT_3139004 [Mycena olivaceomarginata]|nr:hypothetical protein B0H14DRAFT_3139004 [Mycena olivaceomarginata]